MARLALSEVFGRQRAQQSATVQRHVNPVLSVAGGSRGRPLSGLMAWLRAFGHWNPVLTLVLILSLGGAGWAVLGLVDDYYRHATNDPRNCHVIIKEVRERTIDNVGYGDLDVLGSRPWAPAVAAGTSVAGGTTGVEPRATCAAGAAAYGRRDARGWGIAPAYDGQCPGAASTYVRLLTADDYEPIWTRVALLAAPNGEKAASLAAFLDAQDVVENDVIYIADHLENDLGAQRLGELVGSQVCLFDPTWLWPVRLRIGGILDQLPSWERSRFSGYIPSYTYDAFRSQVLNPSVLVEGFTHIALYFDSANLDALEDYLRAQGYGFVHENLEKIRRLLGTAATFKTILSTFLGMVAVLLVLLTATSVGSYLATNAQSFALLRAFGMNWRFVAGVLLIEILVGWLVAMALLSLVIAGMGLYNGGRWWVFDGSILTGAMVWGSFLQVSAVVLGLSILVTLAMTGWWWRKNRYVAHVLKTG